MTDSSTDRGTSRDDGGGHCSRCGAELVFGTVDFADTPDETGDTDLGRVELRPGQMVQSMSCSTPGCAGPDDGARV